MKSLTCGIVAVVSGFLALKAHARPYVIGADISWLNQDESRGMTYSDKGVQKDLIDILKSYKFNVIRARIFVNPSLGYSRGANWCGLEDNMKLAKRVKAAGMGYLLDFHMSDTWASIGEQHVPASWSGKSDPEMQDSAYAHTNRSVKAMIGQGTRPDWVQVGNEINSCMSGVCSSNWPRFAALINAGVKGVRDADPTIKIIMQHGRPREDGNFLAWVDGLIANKVDFDIIGGSTYGTTNNGADWRDQFGKAITKTSKPVISLEHTALRTTLIHDVMTKLPNEMGMGAVFWEPVRYPEDSPADRLFATNGKQYSTIANIDELPKIAAAVSITNYPYVQTTVSTLGWETTVLAAYSLHWRGGRLAYRAPRDGKATLTLHNLKGERLLTQEFNAKLGFNYVDASLLPQINRFGAHFLTLKAAGGEVARLRWAGGDVSAAP